MKNNNISLLLLVLIFVSSGCIKNTYDLNKVSTANAYSPAFVIAAASGNITLADMLKPNDTVVYASDKSLKIVFKKDSVINFQLKDYYDLTNMVKFSRGYKIGDVVIADFKDSLQVPLSSFSSSSAFTPALTNGTYIFPPFGLINLGNKTFNSFSTFQNAVFSSGTITISVKNGLPVKLNNINITLYNNTVPVTPISGVMVIPAINPGATQSATLDLTGKTVTNSITAAVVLTGSPGSAPNPVNVNLSSTFQIKLAATNLKVQSGRIVLPTQIPTSLSGNDMVAFNPGTGIEIEKLRVLTGRFNYTLISTSSVTGSFSFTLPKALKSGVPVSKTININGSTTNVKDTVSLTATDFDLSSDITQPYNKLPLTYSLSVGSNGSMINFKSTDSVHIDLSFQNPKLDYVKGYFGQLSQQITPENLDTGLKDFMSSISGQLHISNPSITLNYSNSFGIPVEVTFNATGTRNTQSVNLSLSPFTISSPTSTTVRDVTSSFVINNANTGSSLSNLVSLPPYQLSFSGSAKMNPAGYTGQRNNYIFWNSRFLGSVEVDVPFTYWLNNIQFSDTLDNFLKPGNSGSNSFNPSDMDSLRVNITAQNGFPMGISVKMLLYSSTKKTVLRTIDASNFLKAAPVDATGKSTGKTETTTTIDFSQAFFDEINSADKVILMFTANTAGNGTTDVTIYSDYAIIFKASVFAKPRVKLN
jgi:hypothetical protein